MTITKEAGILNAQLSEETHSLLSRFGEEAYYPKSGIPGQTGEAKGTRINATLGQAFEDMKDATGKLSPLVLPSFVEAHKIIKKEQIMPYAPSHGIEELRSLWIQEIRRKNPSLTATTSRPVVVGGIAHGLTILNELFAEEGDGLHHFDPFWGNYKLHFKDAECRPIPIYEKEILNLDKLEQDLQRPAKKRLVLLNFPSNPTGYTPTITEIREIKDILRRAAERGNGIVAIADDAYFGLSYKDGNCTESPFAYLADAHPNILAVKADGATKECYSWGLRVGFLTFARAGMTSNEAQALEDKVAGRVRASISNVATPSQWTVVQGIRSPNFRQEVAENKNVLQRRYNTLKNLVREHPNWEEQYTALPFNGGYFMCVELRDADPEQVRRILREEYSTGVLSLGGTKLLRLAYSAVPNDDLPELMENISQACKDAA